MGWLLAPSIRPQDLEHHLIWLQIECRRLGLCLFCRICTLSIKSSSFYPSHSISTAIGLKSTLLMPQALNLINPQPDNQVWSWNSTTLRKHSSYSVSVLKRLLLESTGFTSNLGLWISRSTSSLFTLSVLSSSPNSLSTSSSSGPRWMQLLISIFMRRINVRMHCLRKTEYHLK